MAVASKAVNAELQRRIYAQAGKLPAEGLDWIESIRLEAWADEEGVLHEKISVQPGK